MPKLVKIDSVREDTSRLIEIDEAPSNATDVVANSILPLATYLALADELNEDTGVWLASDEDTLSLAPYLQKLNIIACRFNAFADGRSFSQARILRDHLEFKGEIRAVGYFIQDQMFYLLRCGISEFSVVDDADIKSLQESLSDFSESYQAGCDIPAPLFRRRA